MMGMMFDPEGFQNIGRDLQNLGRDLQTNNIMIRATSQKLSPSAELDNLGYIIKSHILRSMRSTPTGYRAVAAFRKSAGLKTTDKSHYPSYPGNFPAIDSGVLATNIHFNKEGELNLRVGALSLADYAEYLEDESKLNRPFLKPTKSKFENYFNRKMQSIVMKNINDIMSKSLSK